MKTGLKSIKKKSEANKEYTYALINLLKLKIIGPQTLPSPTPMDKETHDLIVIL